MMDGIFRQQAGIGNRVPRIDPVELRRRNDTDREPIKGLPYTSRSLMSCFDSGGEAFGWRERHPRPGSMQDGEWTVGWGCAATMYPTQIGPATARVSMTPQGAVKVQTAAHEIGNGAYTVIALTASDRLGIALDSITVELGDSDLPPAPVAGGSNTTASVCNVVAKACEQIRARIAEAAVKAADGAFAGKDASRLVLADGWLNGPDGVAEPIEAAVGRVSNGAIEAYAENIPHGIAADGIKKLYLGHAMLAGGAKLKDRIQFAFGAEFVGVRVHLRTREIRCPRIVGAFAAGRIVDPVTAESQLMGGLIWGVSSALHEATEIDRRRARYTNTDLAEYLMPANADIEGGGDSRSRGGSSDQRSRHQGAGRTRQCRYERGDRERRLARHRCQNPRAADPARKAARRPGVGAVTEVLERPGTTTLGELSREEAECRRCPLYRNATQVVPGEGETSADLMLVGEQPGDREDLAGEPFVGPAGHILERALTDASIARSKVFVTNAVKHFKYEQRGKRRLHKRPNADEIERCRWWLDLEGAVVRPTVILALGATAARSLLGRPVTLAKVRGRPLTVIDGATILVTIHPSFLLRIRDRVAEEHEYRKFVADLRTAAALSGTD